jgi:uncharacterized protein (TIGR03492 family)
MLWSAHGDRKRRSNGESAAFLPALGAASATWQQRFARRCHVLTRRQQPLGRGLRACATAERKQPLLETLNIDLLCLLCLSNGHGEDVVATQVLRALYRCSPRPLWTDALPLVGAGEAYKRLARDQVIDYWEEPLSVPELTRTDTGELRTRSALCLLGPRGTMPSGGFIYARPLTFLRDLAAGLFGLVYGQWRRCRGWLLEKTRHLSGATTRRCCYLVLAVGDVWPLLLSVLSGVRLGAFIGTAKSDLYLQHPSGDWLFMQPYPHRWTSDRWVYGLTASEADGFRLQPLHSPRYPAWFWQCWRFWCLLLLDLRYAFYLFRRWGVLRAPFLWRLARLGEAIGTGASVYLPWERWLMQRLGTLGIYVRDALTARRLQRLGVQRVATLALNPMMDDILERDAGAASVRNHMDSFHVALLPGSRPPEAYHNWRRMLRELEKALTASGPAQFSFQVPVASTLSISLLKDIAREQGWVDSNPFDEGSTTAARTGEVLLDDMVYRHGNHRLRFWSPAVSGGNARANNSFAACLHRAEVVFACAGTATEQAVGIGKPVITSPGAGPQFNRSFWEAQSRLLGPNIILADPGREHPDAVSKALINLWAAMRDDQQRQTLVSVWSQQAAAVMGRSGAADYIARSMLERLSKKVEHEQLQNSISS